MKAGLQNRVAGRYKLETCTNACVTPFGHYLCSLAMTCIHSDQPQIRTQVLLSFGHQNKVDTSYSQQLFSLVRVQVQCSNFFSNLSLTCESIWPPNKVCFHKLAIPVTTWDSAWSGLYGRGRVEKVKTVQILERPINYNWKRGEAQFITASFKSTPLSFLPVVLTTKRILANHQTFK